ncbi:Gfo/Idh/MocA family protein [Algoriphagus zhangzhouensis]|uniref:Predicted dehydrogenase n=1 Tax=Algoriphagus zhangzhouensis TaxID=1073327 RepID=A0A1M7ZHC0_9BACT|nr:Gfo/Idh/MocA family oxidoreductase [Algoriphagus zhangzhouensis]TDY44642.1 putative dehydrogenase [Algoriphagus zhangzhouensis]SHO64066.1 Predicted dehydrogenase [Algoriphagus zhangzhouensis]
MNALNRRDFIKGSSAMMTLASFGLLGMDFKDQEGPIRVALIGTGWYGKSDLFRLIQVADVEVVGLCDPDRHILEAAGQLVSERQKSGKVPALYEDYKELLAKEKPEFVLIGSPDHWHALMAIDALKAGAHVYVQKPISVDVIEGEAMVAAARKYNRKVQVGTQRKSTPHLIQAKKEIIDTGKLGKISHAEVCCYYHMRANGNPPVEPVPDFFNYDLWAGPAPKRPYDGLPHIRWWRTFIEYGNGITGDMCVHMLDTVRWMLKLGWPTQITSTGGIYVQKDGKSNISDTQSAIFEYPELNVVWQHRTWGNPTDPEYPWAFKIYGEKGMLAGSTMQADFIPLEEGVEPIHYDVVYEREEYPEDVDEERIELNAAPATRIHMKNWLNAIETDTLPIADIEEGHISTASCILANISMDLGGRALKYDPKTRTIIGDPEATAKLKRPYRAPYVHPDPNNV